MTAFNIPITKKHVMIVENFKDRGNPDLYLKILFVSGNKYVPSVLQKLFSQCCEGTY
jgi:hypothetical protein